MGSQKRTPISDRHLIAEQPGMTLLIAGFFVAFLVGHTTKSLLSPSRVSARIEKAASHIHKDVDVKFSSARISLSDGIMPRFSVIITDVHMESAQKCWGSPVLDVDELRLPLSFMNLIRGRPPVRNIEAENVSLVLRDNFEECHRAESEIEKPSDTGKAPAPLISVSPSEQSQKYRNDIRGISVGSLKIMPEKHSQYATEFLNFSARVRSFEPKVIEIRAKSNLLRDQRVGDYLSHANLYMQYKESPAPTVQTHFYGNWREGHYSLIANYTIDDKLLAVESDLKHIPLSQILGLLQRYGLASNDLNGRQVWISSKARMMSGIDDLKKAPLEVRDLRLEGDLGEVAIDRIDISSIDPFKYSPILVDVKKLDLEKLLVLLNRPKQTGFLGNLGVFTGRAEIISEQRMHMRGEHSGLEFLFSNKGQREVQVLDRIVGDVSLDKDSWIFQVKRIEPREGLFVGDVSMKADRDFKKIDVRTHIDELSLAPTVQKLMTSGGSIGTSKMDAQLSLEKGQISYLKGVYNLAGMQIEGVDLGATKFQLDWQNNEFVLKTQLRSLEMTASSPAAELLNPMIPAIYRNAGNIQMTSLTGRLQGKDLKNISWKDFEAHLGKGGMLKTEGSWDQFGDVQGQVSLHESSKKNMKWKISGTRETPVFTEDKNANTTLRK